LSNINTIIPNTGRAIQEDGDVVNYADMIEQIFKTIVVAGVATIDGTASIIVDNTKDFEPEVVTNKLAKVTIEGVTYIREVHSCSGRLISISPIREAVAASVILSGVGSATIRCKSVGDEANLYKVVVENGTEASSSLSVSFDSETSTITITSATDGEGVPSDILAGNIETLFASVPAVDELFSVDDEFTAGALSLVAAPGTSFTGGVDEIVVPEGTPYEILSIEPGVSRVEVDGMGRVDTTPVIDPDALSANELGLLRGILKYLKDGKFTPIDTDGNSLFTDSKPGSMKLTGSNVTDGEGTLTASYEKDPDGNGVLRTVDAAPVAYDEVNDILKTKITDGTNTVLIDSATKALKVKTMSDYVERSFNLVVGAGATVTSDIFQLENRKLVLIMLASSPTITYTLKIRMMKANEASPYGQVDVASSKVGANSFDIFSTGWEAPFYRLALTDVSGTGLTGVICIKERVL